jgi:hypothetical protein
MRANPKDRIAGFPAPIAREVMRRFDQALPDDLLSDYVNDDDRNCSEIAHALAAEGLLDLHHTDAHGLIGVCVAFDRLVRGVRQPQSNRPRHHLMLARG